MPMPRVPPVTTATLPEMSNRSMSSLPRQHPVAGSGPVERRGVGAVDELADDAGEALRHVRVREVARLVEDDQPAAGHRLVRGMRVVHRDDPVAPAPEDQRGDVLGEVEPVARADPLAGGAGDRADGPDEGGPSVAVGQPGDAVHDLALLAALADADRRQGGLDRAGRLADQTEDELGARQRRRADERADLPPESSARDEHHPADLLRELVGELHDDAAAERVTDERRPLDV